MINQAQKKISNLNKKSQLIDRIVGIVEKIVSKGTIVDRKVSR